jgi:hypothetical protein
MQVQDDIADTTTAHDPGLPGGRNRLDRAGTGRAGPSAGAILKRMRIAALIALLLGFTLPASAAAGATASDPLIATLDALLALERPQGGWALVAGPRQRPRSTRFVLRLAERVAAPLGLATWDVVGLRSPGTPAAGLVLLEGYRLTGRPSYLAAACRTADLLLALQLRAGGWFSDTPVHGAAVPAWFRWTVPGIPMDDDVTPGATRLLLTLAAATGDARYRERAERALALLLRAQLASGAWPRIWRPGWMRVVRPTYADLPTLNDGATPYVIETLLVAYRLLGRPELLDAARRGGNWLVRVRGLPPQAGWAQQYGFDDHPAGARAFEPPAVSSWESRYAIEALLALAGVTRDERYCATIPDAVRWLSRSVLAPGCWSRLYTLGTNRPLFVRRDGEPVATAHDAGAGYRWTGDFGIPGLLARLDMGDPAPRRIPGDPGACPAQETPAEHDGPRRLIARAAVLVGERTPTGPAPCTSDGHVRGG